MRLLVILALFLVVLSVRANPEEKKILRSRRSLDDFLPVPLCDALIVPCLSNFARFFEFRLQIDVLNIYDRVTERDAEIAALRAAKEREEAGLFAEMLERTREEADLKLEAAEAEGELRKVRHRNALEHLRQLRKRLKSTRWRVERMEAVERGKKKRKF